MKVLFKTKTFGIYINDVYILNFRKYNGYYLKGFKLYLGYIYIEYLKFTDES
jgi:hypothetical protein